MKITNDTDIPLEVEISLKYTGKIEPGTSIEEECLKAEIVELIIKGVSDA